MAENRKSRIGRVISNNTEKTAVVAVETSRHHPVYKKLMKRTVKYYAHDEEKKSRVGDLVKIVETRPLSRLKRWRIAEIIVRGEVAEVKPEEITQESG